jgi:hypothetical protein
MQGRHEFKFGGEMRVHRTNEGQPGTPAGYFTLDYNTTSQGPDYGGGDAMAGLLTGTSTTGWGQYEIRPTSLGRISATPGIFRMTIASATSSR